MTLAGRGKDRLVRTAQEAGLPVAVAVAGADDAGLHEGAATHHADAVHVIVAQMEMPLQSKKQASALAQFLGSVQCKGYFMLAACRMRS